MKNKRIYFDKGQKHFYYDGPKEVEELSDMWHSWLSNLGWDLMKKAIELHEKENLDYKEVALRLADDHIEPDTQMHYGLGVTEII